MTYDQVILGVLVFSLLVTVILLGYVAFTSPRVMREGRVRKH